MSKPKGAGGIRCQACGSPLESSSTVCSTCGVGPDSGRRFWRIFWTAMIISTILVVIVSLVVLSYAPRFAPHLFKPDERNLIP